MHQSALVDGDGGVGVVDVLVQAETVDGQVFAVRTHVTEGEGQVLVGIFRKIECDFLPGGASESVLLRP